VNRSTKSFRLQVLSLQILFRILSDTLLMMYLLFHDRRTLESSLSLTRIVRVYRSCQAHTWFQVGRLTEHGSMRRSCRSYSPVTSSHQLVQNTLRISEKLTDVYCKSRSVNRFVVMSPTRADFEPLPIGSGRHASHSLNSWSKLYSMLAELHKYQINTCIRMELTRES